jgi:hypothetical protein
MKIEFKGMKRSGVYFALVLCGLLFGVHSARAQKKIAQYCVAFYNQENLFDTIHDAGKNDFEYLPEGVNKWNSMRYLSKLKNMSKVISMFGEREITVNGVKKKVQVRPAIIGLSEVENIGVLRDLVAQPALQNRNLKIVHVEGPDKRGIDVAFLLDSTQFKLQSTNYVNYVYENGDTVRKTRGFLVVRGVLAGEDVAAIVNHWPSRGAGSEFREMAGRQVRRVKDSLQALNPDIKLFIMGDLNDDPTNKSVTEALGAKHKVKDTGKQDLYNPWYDIIKKGQGTLLYDGKWNLFDQIMFTGNMLNDTDRSTLTYQRPEIFSREFMFQTEGKYKGAPLRTYSGGVWLNGYSDHLPTMIWLVKEVK